MRAEEVGESHIWHKDYVFFSKDIAQSPEYSALVFLFLFDYIRLGVIEVVHMFDGLGYGISTFLIRSQMVFR